MVQICFQSLAQRITATFRGQGVFRAWLDRPYEEYEFWPQGAAIPTRRNVEAPGRIGKRRNWINLSTSAWSQLARFANTSGFVVASEAIDASQRHSSRP